jgi:hypothetical protein
VVQALAEALCLPRADLGRTMVQPEAMQMLPRQVAKRYGGLVLTSERKGAKITVAMGDRARAVLAAALSNAKRHQWLGVWLLVSGASGAAARRPRR